jgi:hypothetical protein
MTTANEQDHIDVEMLLKLQGVHLDALRIISAALGHPYKGQTDKSCIDLAKLAAQRLTEKSELDKFAHSMAYDGCCCHIEGACTMHGDIETPWYNLATEMSDDERREINAEVAYLEERGLLIRDCMDDNMVRFRDESEATRP